jgi:hypothetical protein
VANTVEQLVVELDARTAAFEQRLATAEGKLGSLKRTANDTGTALDRFGNSANKAIGGVGAKANTVAKAISGVSQEMAAFGRTGEVAFTRIGDSAAKAASTLGTTGALAGAVATIGVALVAVGAQAARMAEDVEKGIRRVVASVPDGAKGIELLRQQLRTLSEEFGISQAELSRQAGEIAKQGAQGADEVAQRLRASVLAFKATGTELGAVASGLDQTLDLFQLTGDQAVEVVAKLASVSKGRNSLEDVFAGLQAAAPAVQKLNFDLDTTIRALVALGERGLSARQAGAYLGQMAEKGEEGRKVIAGLAKEATVAADAMGDLNTRVKQASDGIDDTAAKLRERLNNNLIDLGKRILPFVNRELEGLIGLLDRVSGALTDVRLESSKATAISLGTQFDRLSSISIKEPEKAKEGPEAVIRARQELARFRTALFDVMDAVREGRIDIRALSANELAGLSKAFTSFDQAQADWLQRPGQELHDFATLLRKVADEQQKAAEAAKKSAATSKPAGPSKRSPLIDPSTLGTNKGLPDVDRSTDSLKRFRDEMDTLRASITTNDPIDDLNSRFQKFATSVDIAVREAGQDLEKLRAKGAKPVQISIAETNLKGLEAVRAEIDRVHDAALAVAREQIGQRIEQSIAEISTSGIDNLKLALRQLEKELQEGVKVGTVSPEFLTEIQKANEELLETTKKSEALEERIKRLREDGVKPLRAVSELLKRRTQEETRIEQLKGKGVAFDREREQIEENIAKIDAEIAKHTDENGKNLKEATTEAGNLFGAFADLANIALGVATAVGGIDDELTKAVSSAANLFDGLSDIAKAAKAAGGLSKLFSTGKGLLEALPGIGQIIAGVAGIGQIFFGEDPDEKESREATQRNTEALRKLESAIGDLAKITASGSQLASVRSVVTGFTFDVGGSATQAIRDKKIAEAFQSTLRAAGVSMEDVRKIAAELGFDLTKITEEGLRAFQKALNELDFQAFTETFAGGLEQLGDAFTLFETGKSDQFQKLVELLTDPEKGAPALFGALDGLDLSTTEGREKAKQVIQGIFQGIVDGSIDPALLGGLNLDQLRQILKDLFGVVIDVADEEAAKAAEEAQRILEARAKGLAELGDQFTIEGTDAAGQLKALAEFFASQFEEFTGLLDGVDLSSKEGLNTVRERIRAIFEALQADGITEAEQQIIDALKALLGPLDAATDGIATFTDGVVTLAEQLQTAFDAIDLKGRVFGETPQQTLGKKLEQFGLPGADLSTEAGIQATIKALQDAFTAATDENTQRLIAGLVDELRGLLGDLPGAVSDATGGGGTTNAVTNAAQALTERTGNRMADFLRTGLTYARQTVELLTSIRNQIGTVAALPSLTPPALPSPAAGSVSSSVAIGQLVLPPVTVQQIPGETAEATAAKFSRAVLLKLAEQLDPIFAERARATQRTLGVVRVSG